jgi:hypothetical protein
MGAPTTPSERCYEVRSPDGTVQVGSPTMPRTRWATWNPADLERLLDADEYVALLAEEK